MTEADDINGVIPPVITPFYNQRLDEISYGGLLEYIFNEGCSGGFCFGTTSEDHHLQISTKKEGITFLARNFSDQILLLGTNGKTLEETIELTRFAAEQGIKTVVLIPLLVGPDPVESVEQAVYGTGLNVLIYNIPSRTNGQNLPVRDVVRLAQLPYVIGIKESSSDITYLGDVACKVPPDFKIFVGTQSKLEDAFRTVPHISGFVPSVGNTNPKLVVDIWKYKRPADFAELRRIVALYKNYESPAQAEKEWAHEKGLIRSPELVNGRA